MGGVLAGTVASAARQMEISNMQANIGVLRAVRPVILGALVLGAGAVDATGTLPDPTCAQFRLPPLEQGSMLQTTQPNGPESAMVRRSLPVAVGAEFIGPTRYAIGEDDQIMLMELDLFTLAPGPGSCLSCKRPHPSVGPLLKIAVRSERPDLSVSGILARVFFDLEGSANKFTFNPETNSYSFDYSGYVELGSEFDGVTKVEYPGKRRSINEGRSFYYDLADDGTVKGALRCDNVGRVPVPHCDYYADAGELTYDATFRRTLMPEFERIKAVSEKFVSCLLEPLDQVPESTRTTGGEGE